MKLKAYATSNARRALRVRIESKVLNELQLNDFISVLDCVSLNTEIYLSIFKHTEKYPVISIDDYIDYLMLLNIPLSYSDELSKTLPILLTILEEKYGIEYVNAES